MSLRTACNHCNTPMKSRVKHQEIAGAPQDLRKTANMLPLPKNTKDITRQHPQDCDDPIMQPSYREALTTNIKPGEYYTSKRP